MNEKGNIIIFILDLIFIIVFLVLSIINIFGGGF
jgi:hypothetical protein